MPFIYMQVKQWKGPQTTHVCNVINSINITTSKKHH